VSPPVHVSTAAAYRALAESRRGGPPHAAAGGEEPRELKRWSDLAKLGHNDFQNVIARAHPEVERSLAALRAAGATIALMSGSGSSCVGLFADGDSARLAAESIEAELRWPCRPARTLAALPRPRES
jgi:4-diphosphocytidyl-2-C-methyl-D-erythritol kinase